MNRRQFAAALGAALLTRPALRLNTAARPKSMVALARSPRLQRQGDDVDAGSAVYFLNQALQAITGKTSAQAAWQSLFKPRERIGIKLSCLPGQRLSSSRGVVRAIIAGLQSAGVATENIIVWERTERELQRAGFAAGSLAARIAGIDSGGDWGYLDQVEIAGSVGTCFARIMTEVDAHIVMPVLKDHDIAGISAAMKNFYGAIHNPNKYHANHCDPYVADLCAHPLIKDKLRLAVVDASRVQAHNGPAYFPAYAVEYGALLVSTDMVAADAIGWRLIDEQRARLQLPSLKEAGREPRYILTAAAKGLGQADVNAIQLVTV